ncbi:MAG: cation diffusion facilitator family transporter [Acidobacteriota bacterium]|nr:cation diffusion facilitator family transporter [Acidobacteriota bacterium]
MALKPVDERDKKIRSITLWGSLVNILLMALKTGIGVLIRSSALVADGIHSFSDLVTDFIVLLGTRLSTRPADKTHPYGHKKFETFAAMLIAVILFAVSIGFVLSAGFSIYRHEHNFPGPLVLVVAGISIIAKEILFRKTRNISKITNSAALFANAWHHRSDSFSSVAVLIGGIASVLGYGHADQAATIIVGFMIIGVAGKIFYECLIELMEHSADKESIRTIEKVLSKEKEIVDWHALRTRKLGGEIFIDFHVSVDTRLSVFKSHEISRKIEEKIQGALSNPMNILIHVDPAADPEKVQD